MRTTICLLLLFTIATFAKTQCVAEATLALTKDEFKQEGETALPSVTVMTEPSTEFNATGLCGAYWTANGGNTCCNQAELKTRMEAMIARGKARAKAMKESLKKAETGNAVNDDVDILLEIATEAEAGSGGAGTRRLVELAMRMLQDPAPTEEQMKANRKKMFENVDKRKGKAKGQAQKAINQAVKCYTKYLKEQINTLCLRCSSKVGDFFDTATGAWKVSQGFCKSMAKSCGQPLAFQAQRVALDKAVRKLAKQVDPTATIEGADEPAIEDPAQLESINTCAEGDCSENDASRKVFCDNLNLDGDSPILLGARADIGNFDLKKVKGFEAKKEAKDKKGAGGNTKGNRRILTTAPTGGYCTEQATGGADVESINGAPQLNESDFDTNSPPPPAFISIAAI